MKHHVLACIAVATLLALTAPDAAAQEFPDVLRLEAALRAPGAPKAASSLINVRVDIVNDVDAVLHAEEHCGVAPHGEDARISMFLGETTPFDLPFDELYWAVIEGCQDDLGCAGEGFPGSCPPNDVVSVRVPLDATAWAHLSRDALWLGGRPAGDFLGDDTILDGDVAGPFDDLQLKPDVVTSRELGDDVVRSADLSPDAVGTAELADGGVESADLADNAVLSPGIADGAVGSGQLANDTVRSSAFADGAVGAAAIARVYGPNINASEVQRRITGRCSIDERIRVIHEDGTVECEPAAASSGCVNETHGIKEFKSTSEFLVPDGVCSLEVSLWGAGGGGGGGLWRGHGGSLGDLPDGTTRHGGGGGAGAVVQASISVAEGELLTVSVGRGGTGGERFCAFRPMIQDPPMRPCASRSGSNYDHDEAEAGSNGDATRIWVERSGSDIQLIRAGGGQGGEGGSFRPNAHGAAGGTTGSVTPTDSMVRPGLPGSGSGDGHRWEASAHRGLELFQPGDRGHGGRGGHRGHYDTDPAPFDGDHEAPTDGESGLPGYAIARW